MEKGILVADDETEDTPKKPISEYEDTYDHPEIETLRGFYSVMDCE